jgi:hypothetical protein
MNECRVGRHVTLVVLALAMAACAPEDSTVGSHLAQPPPNSPPREATDAGDIAIVGQDAAHSILDLPVIADASTPPLVQFTGVTSIITPPIDTDPYTELLRDRLLLLTREKLRFVERTLPPLVITSKKGHKKAPAASSEESTGPDYQVLAELRGQADAEFYRVQIQFINIHTNEILFDGLYRIRKESAMDQSPDVPPDQTQAPLAPDGTPSAPPPDSGSSTL